MGLTARQTMGVAALMMGASVFLSRIMGLVRDKVISWQFGAGADTDVYFAAFVIPDFINYLLAGGYVSMTLIPLLSAAFSEDEEDGWRFFSCVITWNTVAASILVVLGFVFAPQLARLTMPGFDAVQLDRLTLYLRIILPGQLFFLAGSCLTALLYLRKTFAVPALTPLIYNGCIILGGLGWPLLAAWAPGALAGGAMTGYACGATFGAVLGAFALPLAAALAGEGRLRFRPLLSHPLLKRYILLALPLMIGQSIVVLDEQLIRVFGSLAGEGVVSQLNYARRVVLVPVGVVAQAAGVASFPFLASLAASGDGAGFDATLNKALRKGLFVMLPVTVWMITAAEPILGLLFEGGRFSRADTAASAALLQLLLLSLPFWLVQQVLGRAFYARQDTLSPAVLGTAVTVLALPVYWLATSRWGPPGIALVSAASIGFYAAFLVLWWMRRFGTGTFHGSANPILRCAGLSGVAGLVSGMTAAGLRDVSPDLFMPMIQQIMPGLARLLSSLALHGLVLAATLVTFLAVYAGLALALHPECLGRPRRPSAGGAS